MTHTPAPPWEQLGITEAAWHEREAGVAQITAGAETPAAPENSKRERKTRSDAGIQRGPKAPGEPEAAATVETTSITVELTAIQYADLEREAARVYRDIEPRYLTTEPAVVLLNSRVQKHWRTLVGK